MPGGIKGMTVGFFNTIAVAICIGVVSKEAGLMQIAILVTLFGAIPGTLTGGLLGHIAASMQHFNRRVVLAMMITIACFAVYMLGDMFAVKELVIVSCIPTAASCSILERWTRAKPEGVIPIARVA